VGQPPRFRISSSFSNPGRLVSAGYAVLCAFFDSPLRNSRVSSMSSQTYGGEMNNKQSKRRAGPYTAISAVSSRGGSGWLGSTWALRRGPVVVLWAATGPVFHFSTTGRCDRHWNVHRYISDGLFDPETQNRDARAIHLKLNELIRAMDTAHNQMIDIERLSDLELDAMQAYLRKDKKQAGLSARANLSPLSGEMKRNLCRGTRSTRRWILWHAQSEDAPRKDVSCVRRRALEIPCVPFALRTVRPS